MPVQFTVTGILSNLEGLIVEPGLWNLAAPVTAPEKEIEAFCLFRG
jgi:hypothetical protein